jgi:hypothetical protein
VPCWPAGEVVRVRVCGVLQMAAQVVLTSRLRRAMMASALAAVQCLPACEVPDDRLAAGIDDAGSDEEAAEAEPLAAHAGRIVQEVAELFAGLGFL